MKQLMGTSDLIVQPQMDHNWNASQGTSTELEETDVAEEPEKGVIHRATIAMDSIAYRSKRKTTHK